MQVNSDPSGRVEGVKVSNSNFVAVQNGIVANNVLAVKLMQNHINCARSAIVATNVDQSFFIGNLIYQNAAGDNGAPPASLLVFREACDCMVAV